jgi:hypothetical protein
MVIVTNAPEGRTYINYEWILRNTLTRMPDFPYDYEQVSTPLVVSNDKWVMERPSGYAWLIGDRDAIEHLRFTDVHGTDHILYISDQPFGWIVCDEEDVNKSVYPPIPGGRRRLHYARQIHKGELGQGIPVKRLPYVRQAYEDNQKLSVTKPHQRRRGYGWVRLADLVEATSLSYEDIVFGYWDYSGHQNYRFYNNDQEGGVLLDMVRTSFEDDIKGQVPNIMSLTRSDAANRLVGWGNSRFWVRRGFAYTVLRLQALGVQPYAMQPA